MPICNNAKKAALFFIILYSFFTIIKVHANITPKDTLEKINGRANSPEVYLSYLEKLDDKSFAKALTLAQNFEGEHNFLKSIEQLKFIQHQFPQSTYLLWRLSRAYWIHGESLALDDKKNRLRFFQIGLDWAEKGLALDKNCAECHMYKFANLGRLSTTKGLLNSISSAKELSDTIDKTIALKPQHKDSDYNSALANAYYASGVFYRIIPDSFLVKVIARVRGDKYKALDHIKKATEITPSRIDYQVELGALYLCLANDKGEEQYREMGRNTLKHALGLKTILPTDPLDKKYALDFLADASQACAFSRDGMVKVDKASYEKHKNQQN